MALFGYRLECDGEFRRRGEACANIIGVFLHLLGLMLAFNSFRYAPVIGLVAIFSYSMGFMAVTGVMSLIDLAINDNIFILSV